MNSLLRITLVVATIALAGCATAPQLPIPLEPAHVTGKGGRIGVAMAPLPAVDTSLPGAGCLLCMATASLANSGLTSHAKTLTVEDLPKLKNKIAETLRKRGAEAIVIEDALDFSKLPDTASPGPNVASKDFTSFARSHKVDRLLVIELNLLGFERTYSAYIPTSDPKAVFRGRGFLVNLANNGYEWYLPVNVLKSADGAWDEPPKYPGLSNAYFQALELGQDALIDALSAK